MDLAILNLRPAFYRLGLALSDSQEVALTSPYVFAVIALLATLVASSLAMLVLY
jgi:hypothetical protein